METWLEGTHRGGRNNPSFSSSLLDAIYRSIDDAGAAPDPSLFPSSATATATAAKQPKMLQRRQFVTSTSSSSGFSGFSSSSDAESVRPKLAPPQLPPEKTTTKKKRCGSCSIRSRIKDLRKSKGSAPSSPGARLAGFLNALFSGHNKTKVATTPPPTRNVCCGSVGIVGGEEYGRRSVRDDRGAEAERVTESNRMVAELLIEMDDGGESDSSSDLFELEILNGELPVYGTTQIAPSLTV